MAQLNERKGYIVLDENDSDKGIKRLMDKVKQNEELWSRFITPEQAMEFANDESLLVVVDTHKPSMVMEQKLLHKIENVVVIDHHRRGEDFIEDPLLVYMEPYASSTAELVTELLEYQPKNLKMTMLEATALLAGIIVDTKSFTFRTGARTFDLCFLFTLTWCRYCTCTRTFKGRYGSVFTGCKSYKKCVHL